MNFASCLTEVRLELRWKSHRMSFYTDFTFFYRSVIVRFFFLLYDIEVKMREKRKSSHELGRLRQRKKNMTYKEIKKNEEVLAYLKKGNDNLGTMGFTDHSDAHCAMVAERAAMILKKFGYSDHDIELVKIAGFMHDMGNAINRHAHAEYGALLASQILEKTDLPSRLPSFTARKKAVRSAQQVAVNPAFSMLHPAYTVPSAHSRAAPTANPE